MKDLIKRYKTWRHEMRVKWGQAYADMIIHRLQGAKTEWEFDYWMNQGVALNARMIMLHNIYLD